MLHKNGAVMQAYNVQIAVDEQAQVIVAEAVTNQAPDFRRFSLRGLAQVRPKGSLICATHTLLELFRAQAASATLA